MIIDDVVLEQTVAQMKPVSDREQQGLYNSLGYTKRSAAGWSHATRFNHVAPMPRAALPCSFDQAFVPRWYTASK